MELRINPNEDEVAELLTLTCEVSKSGIKRYYNKDGNLHRMYGPAVIWPDGTKAYYKNDLLHREDGPAVIYNDGTKFWYKNGELLRIAETKT